MKHKFFTLMITALFFAFSANAQDFGLAPKSKNANQNLVKTESMQKSSVKGVIFEDDFEASSGWTLEAPFEIGTASIEPDAAHSGTEILGGPLNADYPNNQAQVFATSPVIDCSGETVVLFSYWSFSGCENDSWDHMGLEVYDGSAWVEIWSNTDWGGSVQEDAWTYYEFDVTTYAAGNADFQVRYYLGATDGSVPYSGWGIDDFQLFYPEPHDLGVTAIAPTFVNSGETVTPQVTIQNFGTADESSYDVQLTIDDGYDQTVNVTDVVSFGNTIVVDMPDWAPADGTYNMTATVTVADDANADNDVMSAEATVAGLQDAYAGNTTAGTYNEILLSDGTLNQVGAIATSPFPMAEEYNGTAIYRVNADMTFGTVGPDGTYTNIGTLTGFAGTPTGLAWDWDNEVMYVMMLDGSNLPNLCTLDMGTLALTQVGSAGTAMTIAIDFANDGYIYGTALNDESLYQYDPATGAETLIGATGITDLNYGQDVSFDAQDNLFYTISCGSDYKFGTIDLATGAFTEILDMAGDQYGTLVITKEPLPSYTVTFNVDDGTDPIEGANINVAGADLTTDALGEATIDLVDGDYDWTATLAGYEDATGSLTVAGGPESVDVSMTLLPTYTVTFTIDDGTDPLDGVNIAVGGQDLITDATGVAIIDLFDGDYDWTATLAGYEDTTGSVTVAGGPESVDVSMSLIPVLYTVTFHVDMTDPIDQGDFVPGTDTVIVGGDMNGWAEPGTDPSMFMEDADEDGIYTVSMDVEDGAHEYKYFKGAGWDGGEWEGGDNRMFTVAGETLILDDVWGLVSISDAVRATFSVYPNPTSGVLHIDAQGSGTVTVLNVIGHVVMTTEINGQGTIDLSNNASGMYFIRLNSGNQVGTQRIIVE